MHFVTVEISALQRAACFFLQGMSRDLQLEIKKSDAKQF